MEAPPFAGREIPLRRKLGPGFLFFAGILFPAFTIGFELVTRMCANGLFDPVPTLGHLAAVVAVPAINLRLWLLARSEEPPGRGWTFAGAAAIAVAASYALLFLPVYPVAVIAIIFAGLGFLPFAPFSAGLSGVFLLRRLTRREPQSRKGLIAAGLVSGFALVLLLDVPAAVTRIAISGISSPDSRDRERALGLMRHFGDEDLLLRYCYDNSRRSGGLLGILVEGGLKLTLDEFADDRAVFSPMAARELYYRVNGVPFNTVEPPYNRGSWEFVNGREWDPDQGGTAIGGRVRGLGLRSSRLDGSMDADDAVAYLEWTTEFTNASALMHEARMTLALPPGAVVSRATLWVNGEEREAVFASRAAARAAYEAVVRARRDPLLVTTNGADQVFVQMFPVMPGTTARLRIGISAPLALTNDGRATLALPAIVDRNFNVDGALRHSVWIEGEGREAPSDAGFAQNAAEGATIRARASFTDAELASRRPRLALIRNPSAQTVVSGEIVQTIRREPRDPPGALMIVLDGSKPAKAAGAALLSAADGIPAGARVGFAIAAPGSAPLPVAPWTPGRKTQLAALIDAAPFDGGEDNLGVLADQLAALEGEPGAALLWIHGPQGFDFPEHTAQLEQLLDRSLRLPAFELLPVTPGPNTLLQHPRVFGAASTRAWSGDPRADIAAAFKDHFDDSQRWTVTRAPGPATGHVAGSPHVANLWARGEVDALIAQGPAHFDEATQLAGQYRLVTPVSGAVVLESDAQYVAAGLTPPDPGAVPTIPEPSTWALLIVACLAFFWAVRRQRMAAA
jgi:vault protein inter-alpha-trypsin-like protein